jgi:hypothetical protein
MSNHAIKHCQMVLPFVLKLQILNTYMDDLIITQVGCQSLDINANIYIKKGIIIIIIILKITLQLMYNQQDNWWLTLMHNS